MDRILFRLARKNEICLKCLVFASKIKLIRVEYFHNNVSMDFAPGIRVARRFCARKKYAIRERMAAIR